MKNLAEIKRRTSSRIPENQTGLALLDATVTGKKAKELEEKLHRLVIGQEEAIHEIVRSYQTYLAGLSQEGRPIGNFFFLGPTGTGRHAPWRRVTHSGTSSPNLESVDIHDEQYRCC